MGVDGPLSSWGRVGEGGRGMMEVGGGGRACDSW